MSTVPPPSPRVVLISLCRDDLTVQVIFFGEGSQTGDVKVNKEASAMDFKAKL